MKELNDLLFKAIALSLSNVHTATIAKVEQVNQTTINCKPVINGFIDGESVEYPLFEEVPPLFLGGGGSSMSYPVAVGDYALLIITERCFDNWYHGNDYQAPLSVRMHDYSDGIALVGLRPLSTAITIPTETTIKGVTRIGVDDPQDFAALASLVETELSTIKATLDSWKTVFDAHTHVGNLGSPTAPTTTPFDAPTDPGAVGSTYLKTE